MHCCAGTSCGHGQTWINDDIKSNEDDSSNNNSTICSSVAETSVTFCASCVKPLHGGLLCGKLLFADTFLCHPCHYKNRHCFREKKDSDSTGREFKTPVFAGLLTMTPSNNKIQPTTTTRKRPRLDGDSYKNNNDEDDDTKNVTTPGIQFSSWPFRKRARFSNELDQVMTEAVRTVASLGVDTTSLKLVPSSTRQQQSSFDGWNSKSVIQTCQNLSSWPFQKAGLQQSKQFQQSPRECGGTLSGLFQQFWCAAQSTSTSSATTTDKPIFGKGHRN